MRNKLSLIAASTALALTAHAAIDLGNGIKLVPNAIVSVEHNDNLFLSSTNEQSETLSRLSPGIEITSGDGALNTTKFSYNEEFQFYSDQSDLNTSLSLVDLTSSYDDGKMKIDLAAWWHEANQANRDTLGSHLTKRELLHGEITDEVKWTDKSSLAVGITYDSTDYNPAGYADWKRWEIPVDYYYAILPKLDASFGFTYRSNDVSNGPLSNDSDEYFYNVGLRGELTAKLTAEAKAGYLQFKRDIGTDEDALGLEGKMTLAVSAKTNLGLTATNRFGYSGLGDAYRNSGVSGFFDTAISPSFRVGANLYYNTYDYMATSREDDTFSGSARATYTMNEHCEFTANYAYSKNDSNVAAFAYANNIISLSATLKY